MNSEKDMKFSIYRSIGTLGTILFLLLSIRIGGGYQYFIHIPAAILLFCFVFFVPLCTFEKDFLIFIPYSVLSLFFTPNAPVAKFTEISKYASRYTIAGALIIMVIGYIQVLVQMEDPDNIGPGLAMTLLPAFYALLFSEVFFVTVYKAYCSEGSGGLTKEPSFQIRSLFLFLFALGIMGVTCVMFLLAFQTVP